MTTLELIVAVTCGVLAHAVLRLWQHRDAPGVVPSILLLAAAAAYAVSMIHHAPALQAGCMGAALITPLLFTTAVEYTGLKVPGWPMLRWLLAPGVAALAWADVGAGHQGLLGAVAAEPDLLRRADLLQQAHQRLFESTARIGYGFALMTVLAAAWTLATSPAQWRGALALAVIPALMAAVDLAQSHHVVALAGVPLPFLLAAGAPVTTCLLYGSHRFDLRSSTRTLLIDSVSDGMLVVDGRRRIVDCNRAAEQILALGRDAVVGAAAHTVLPREFAAMLQSPVHLRSELAVRTSAEHIWFEVDVTPLTVLGHPAGHLLVARNISERRRAQEALEYSRRALEAANARLEEQSVTDPLTGLKNRRFLFQRLNEEMNRHHRAGAVLGLLLVDIDHFKTVNDTHGHPVGDEALVQVADTLAGLVRDCDVVARLGGEEFGVLAVNSDATGLVALAERVRSAICSVPVACNTYRPMVLTVSIGVAFAGPGTRTPDGLFAEADRHLYAAKHQGRNRVVAAALPLAVSTAAN